MKKENKIENWTPNKLTMFKEKITKEIIFKFFLIAIFNLIVFLIGIGILILCFPFLVIFIGIFFSLAIRWGDFVCGLGFMENIGEFLEKLLH